MGFSNLIASNEGTLYYAGIYCYENVRVINE